MQCDICAWWYHYECSDCGIPKALIQSSSFVCTVCKQCKVKTDRSSERPPKCSDRDKSEDNVSAPKSTASAATFLTPHEESEAFVLVKRTLRHKICRGCGSINEKIAPPFDYLLRHREIYQYFDKKSGSQKSTCGNRLYHVNIDCVRIKHSSVAATDFIIPDSMKSVLSDTHKKHFKQCGLFLNL